MEHSSCLTVCISSTQTATMQGREQCSAKNPGEQNEIYYSRLWKSQLSGKCCRNSKSPSMSHDFTRVVVPLGKLCQNRAPVTAWCMRCKVTDNKNKINEVFLLRALIWEKQDFSLFVENCPDWSLHWLGLISSAHSIITEITELAAIIGHAISCIRENLLKYKSLHLL